MVYTLIVNRVSSEEQSQATQNTALQDYAVKFKKCNTIYQKISAFQYKQVVKFHGEILEKLKEMKQKNEEENTKKGSIEKMISGVSKMFLGEENYKIIFTVPNRFSRSVYAARLFFEELAKLSIKVEFHFCEDPGCNFTFESSESSIPEKFWDAIKAAQASSEDKSKTAIAYARAKRKHKEMNTENNMYSWVSLYYFIKLHFKKDNNLNEFCRDIQRSIFRIYKINIELSAIKYYSDMIQNEEEEDNFIDKSNKLFIECDECHKNRQVSKDLYKKHQDNPGEKFVCSQLVYCKCKYPMIFEDNESEGGGEVNENENEGGGEVNDEEEDGKVYYLKKIIESQWSMANDQKMYLVKWKYLRKNNPAWHTETEMKSWGLGGYIEWWEEHNNPYCLSGSKRTK